MSEMIHVGMAGLGTVGSGVYRVLNRNSEHIVESIGHGVKIKRVVCRNLQKARNLVADTVELSCDWRSLVNDPEIEIVIEVMGGIEPAKSLILEALRQGKNVITANKALLAMHGDEIFQVAKACGRTVAFEASVAGGIPIIKTLREGLVANRIEWIAGIINGTTNYILTMMQSKGISFQQALKQAQSLGYAEADPTFDIEGYDAGHKIAILSALAFGTQFHFDSRHIQGITHVELSDITYADALGYCLKLIAMAKLTDKGIDCRVHPTLVPKSSFFAGINDVMNAVVVKADAVNRIMLAGPGAGSEPTASAIIADLVDMIRQIEPREVVFRKTSTTWVEMSETQSEYYLRCCASVLTPSQMKELFNQYGIGCRRLEVFGDDLTVLTNETQEKTMQSLFNEILSMQGHSKDPVLLRMANF